MKLKNSNFVYKPDPSRMHVKPRVKLEDLALKKNEENSRFIEKLVKKPHNPIYSPDIQDYEMKRNNVRTQWLLRKWEKEHPFQPPMPEKHPLYNLQNLLNEVLKGSAHFAAYSKRDDDWYFDKIRFLSLLRREQKLTKRDLSRENFWQRFLSLQGSLEFMFLKELQLRKILGRLQKTKSMYLLLSKLAIQRRQDMDEHRWEIRRKDQFMGERTTKRKFWESFDKARELKPLDVPQSTASIGNMIKAMSYEEEVAGILTLMAHVRENFILLKAYDLYAQSSPSHASTLVLSRTSGKFHHSVSEMEKKEKKVLETMELYEKMGEVFQIERKKANYKIGETLARRALDEIAMYWDYCNKFRMIVRYSILSTNLREVLSQKAGGIYSSDILRRMKKSNEWLVNLHSSDFAKHIHGTPQDILSYVVTHFDYAKYDLIRVNKSKNNYVLDIKNDVAGKAKLRNAFSIVQIASMYEHVDRASRVEKEYIKTNYTPIHVAMNILSTDASEITLKSGYETDAKVGLYLGQIQRNRDIAAERPTIESLKKVDHRERLLKSENEEAQRLCKEASSWFWIIVENMKTLPFEFNQLNLEMLDRSTHNSIFDVRDKEGFARRYALVTDNELDVPMTELPKRYFEEQLRHQADLLNPHHSQNEHPLKSLASAKGHHSKRQKS